MSLSVSIILPSYNADNYIVQAIESVQAQTFTDWELIIVDDASTDKSVAIIQVLSEQDPRIKLVFLPKNQGPASARNVAIKHAKGRYIAFLDSDDWWPEGKLSKQVAFMQKRHLALSYGGFTKVSEVGEVTACYTPKMTTTYRDMLKGCGFNLDTVMYDTQQVGKCYMEANQISEDYTIWVDILKTGVVAQGLPEVLAFYRTRAGSVSANKAFAASVRWQILRQREKYTWLDSLYCFVCYTIDGIQKYQLRWKR